MRPVMLLLAVIPALTLGACQKAVDPFEDTDATGNGDTDVWPASSADYKLHNGTFLTTLTFPDVAHDDLCCRDFGDISRDFIKNGTNNADNALAAMDAVLSAASNGKVNFSGPIGTAIRVGRYVPLLDHVDIPSTSGNYTLAYFSGSPAEGTTFDSAQNGGGEFLLKPDSFVGDSGTPKFLFGSSTVSGGHLTATDGHFELPLPVAWGRVLMDVQRVQIEADVAIVDGGVTMTNGVLSGFIKVDDWFKAYNQVVNEKCACAELNADVYGRGPSGWEDHCLDTAQGTCTGADAVACGVLLLSNIKDGGICKGMFNAVAAAADLNFDDDDQTYEGLSVGVRFSGVQATSTGLFDGDTDTP